jgi:glutathione S-transferase
VLTLYQAEWCPHSHRVRQRLTELGVDFVARQVAARPEARDDLAAAAGTNMIPVLVPDGEEAVAGADPILAYLDARYHERSDADAHRAKARVDVPTFNEMKGR